MFLCTLSSACVCRGEKKQRKTAPPSFHYSSRRTTHTHMHYNPSLRLLVFFIHIHTWHRASHLHTRTLSRSGGSMYKSEKKIFNDSIETRNTTPCSSGGIVLFSLLLFHFSLSLSRKQVYVHFSWNVVISMEQETKRDRTLHDTTTNARIRA